MIGVADMEQLRFRGTNVELVADAVGALNGQLVLFLHGSGQIRRNWHRTLSEAARRHYRAIALDLRGHGESDWSPDGIYRTELFAEDIRHVIGQIGRQPMLVGTSLGGLTSMLVAASPPPSVRAVVVVDVSPQVEAGGVEEIRAFMGSAKDGFQSLDEAADAVSLHLTHRPRPQDTSGLVRNLRVHDGRYYWHWDPAFFFQMAERPDHIERSVRLMKQAAETLRAPILLVRGGSSNVVSPEGAKAFLELVPHAEHVDIAGARHTVVGDANDAFNDAVFAFLDRVRD